MSKRRTGLYVSGSETDGAFEWHIDKRINTIRTPLREHWNE